jgi:hypothetical protein
MPAMPGEICVQDDGRDFQRRPANLCRTILLSGGLWVISATTGPQSSHLRWNDAKSALPVLIVFNVQSAMCLPCDAAVAHHSAGMRERPAGWSVPAPPSLSMNAKSVSAATTVAAPGAVSSVQASGGADALIAAANLLLCGERSLPSNCNRSREAKRPTKRPTFRRTQKRAACEGTLR